MSDCGARRAHQLSPDSYVVCVLERGHGGAHRFEECEWYDDSPYALPRAAPTPRMMSWSGEEVAPDVEALMFDAAWAALHQTDDAAEGWSQKSFTESAAWAWTEATEQRDEARAQAMEP